MLLDFSWFADDMVLEILGHLPALDIIRYRRVCRRIYLATKERSVWVNVFLRAECPLPPVDLATATVRELESVLVRMEIIYAKWTGTRTTNPRWNLPLRYYDRESGAFYIASTRIREQNPKHREIKIVRHQVIESVVVKTLERDIDWSNPPSNEISVSLLVQGGYLILDTPAFYTQTIAMVHVDTGRFVHCPVHHDEDTDGFDDETGMFFNSRHITSSHVIQVTGSELAVFKLPSTEQLSSSSEPILLEKTQAGSLPRLYNNLSIFRRSDTCFVIVGLFAVQGVTNWREQVHGDKEYIHIQLLTLNLDELSSSCEIREEDTYEAKGRMGSFYLAPCSALSRSTLGLLSVRVPPPTHTSQGFRIARRSRASSYYHLGVRITLAHEGYEKPSITLRELDLLPGGHPERNVASIHSFDPYAGLVLLEEREDEPGTSNKLAIADYVSP
ncbi:hypothetical protein AN958_03703 [Leucoagaricus sp. SymC.cos]|nr:hypothetical protein AN958_03703 [Leucoagaricus sp. SymC.cos]